MMQSLGSSSASSLDELTDDLLIEILRRLPTAKSAVGFKLVSRRWCYLISSPLFVSEFINHHANINNRFIIDSSVVICPKYSQVQDDDIKLLFALSGTQQSPVFEESPANTFTLDFLPVERKFVSVVASCNDLLLCLAEKKDLYVCNPYTQQWLLLPPPPDHKIEVNFRVYFGLVYDYEGWVKGMNEYSFRVVVSTEESRYVFSLRVYCSETRQWNNSLLLGIQHRVCSDIIAYDRKLYWHNLGNVIAYDPFSNETVLLDGSDRGAFNNGSQFHIVSISLGVCQGYLRVMKLVNFVGQTGDVVDYFAVWDLCTKTRRLNLKHRIFLVPQPAIGAEAESLGEQITREGFFGAKLLGFHPNEEDVVCMGFDTNIITFCKIQNGNLEVLPDIFSFPRIDIHCSVRVVMTVVPWWPTLLPMLPQNSDL